MNPSNSSLSDWFHCLLHWVDVSSSSLASLSNRLHFRPIFNFLYASALLFLFTSPFAELCYVLPPTVCCAGTAKSETAFDHCILLPLRNNQNATFGVSLFFFVVAFFSHLSHCSPSATPPLHWPKCNELNGCEGITSRPHPQCR